MRRLSRLGVMLVLVFLGGDILGIGVMLRQIDPVWWRPWLVQIASLALGGLATWYILTEVSHMEEHSTDPSPPIEEIPIPPGQFAERQVLQQLDPQLPGHVWWYDFDPGHSFRLFVAAHPTHHGYQVLKAPTNELAGNRFMAYTPSGVEAEYLVNALNAVPKYEAALTWLEGRIQEVLGLIQQVEANNQRFQTLLSEFQALAKEAIRRGEASERARREAVDRAWFYAQHDEGCSAIYMSSTTLMASRCTCSTGERLREQIGEPEGTRKETTDGDTTRTDG